MAQSKKILENKLRSHYMEIVKTVLEKEGEEVLLSGSNEFSVPCVDEEGNDKFLELIFKIPAGSRDGEPFDGYALADEYAQKVKDNAEKAKEKAEAKAKKIAKDKAEREAKAKAKAEHKAEKEKG